MADEARTQTDKQLEEMERKIEEIYKKSAKNIYKAWDEYMRESEKVIAEYQKAYDDAVKSGDRSMIKLTKAKLEEQKRKQGPDSRVRVNKGTC